jgi:hypothetical protein
MGSIDGCSSGGGGDDALHLFAFPATGFSSDTEGLSGTGNQ